LLSFTSMFVWNAFILTNQTITSCSITKKFRNVNFPSNDRVCDDQIRHLNHLWYLIVMSTKVNNSPFWNFSQERRCHGSVKMTWASGGHGSDWNDSSGRADHLDVSRITISRLIIRLRQTDRTNDKPCSGKSRVTSQREDRHLRLIHLQNCKITVDDTARRTPVLENVRFSRQTVRRRLRESGLRARRPVVRPIRKQRHRTARWASARARRCWRLHTW
jgi:transposase